MSEESESDFLFSAIESAEAKTGVSVTCEVGGIPMEFLIDSGSTVNIVNRRTWERLKSEKVTVDKMWKSSGVIKAYGGNTFSIVGKFSARICHKMVAVKQTLRFLMVTALRF